MRLIDRFVLVDVAATINLTILLRWLMQMRCVGGVASVDVTTTIDAVIDLGQLVQMRCVGGVASVDRWMRLAAIDAAIDFRRWVNETAAIDGKSICVPDDQRGDFIA